MLARVDAKIRVETKVSSEEAQGARNHPWLVAGGWWWWVWGRGGGGEGEHDQSKPKTWFDEPTFRRQPGFVANLETGFGEPQKGFVTNPKKGSQRTPKRVRNEPPKGSERTLLQVRQTRLRGSTNPRHEPQNAFAEPKHASAEPKTGLAEPKNTNSNTGFDEPQKRVRNEPQNGFVTNPQKGS